MENNNNEKNKYAIIIIIVCLLILIVYIIINWNNLVRKTNVPNVNDNNNQNEVDNNNLIDDSTRLDKKYPALTFLGIKDIDDTCEKLNEYNSYLLCKDIYNNKIKLVDNENNNTYEVNLNENLNNSNLIIDESKNIFGIIYKLDDKYKYFDFKDNKVLFSNNEEFSLLTKKYVKITNSLKEFSIYNTESNELVLNKKETKLSDYYEIDLFDLGDFYVYTYCDALRCNFYKNIYDKDFNLLFENIDINNTNLDIDFEGNLYIFKNNILSKYDLKGNLLSKLNLPNNSQFKKVIKGYLIYINDNKLYVTDINNNKTNLGTINNKAEIFENHSYWNVKDEETDNDEGIYIYSRDESVKLDDVWNYCQRNKCEYTSKKEIEESDNSGYGYLYYYNPKTKESYKKPVPIS